MPLDRHIETPVEGMQILQEFLMDRAEPVPDDVRDMLRQRVQPGESPVVSCVEAAELIYARRDELGPGLLEIGAQLAAMCALYNFHGLANDGRGAAIAATIRTMESVASEAPPAALEAPTPKAAYVPSPTVEPTPAQE